ncbi:conserved hypothetical protein [Pontibacter akesuensis]|uniref:TIGR02117 family protein n=2 Tax=Pontibacter akesuensis TaxID=388950 RepID=A0A1I7H338_9BACT|nr:conserved hypothetical protein [Pontibacter akesuensis]
MQQTAMLIFLLLYRGLMGLLGLILLFLLSAFVGSSLTVNSSYAQAKRQGNEVEIFVTSNGVHTSLVLPVSTPYIDWREKLPLHQFAQVDSSYRYLAFGWGDRRFFMQTPEWSDLKPGVALQAAFWPTPTAMHVRYIRSRLIPNRQQQPILVSPEEYRRLIQFIEASFVQQDTVYAHIPESGYTKYDTFYEAHGKYYLLKNCNNWVNEGLKSMGHKAAWWAPLPFSVMRHLR